MNSYSVSFGGYKRKVKYVITKEIIIYTEKERFRFKIFLVFSEVENTLWNLRIIPRWNWNIKADFLQQEMLNFKHFKTFKLNKYNISVLKLTHFSVWLPEERCGVCSTPDTIGTLNATLSSKVPPGYFCHVWWASTLNRRACFSR